MWSSFKHFQQLNPWLLAIDRNSVKMATSNKRPAGAIDFENWCTMAYHTHSQLQEDSKCTSASIPFFDRSNEVDQVCSKLCTTIHPLAALSSLSSAGEERVSSRKFWGGKLKANLKLNKAALEEVKFKVSQISSLFVLPSWYCSAIQIHHRRG